MNLLSMPEPLPMQPDSNDRDAGRADLVGWDARIWRVVFCVLFGSAFVVLIVVLRIAIKYFFDH